MSDEPAELGALLMGLDPERLLAGLGTACTNAETTAILDQPRHGRPDGGALGKGAARWLAVRDTLVAADPGGLRSAAMHQLWSGATRTVAAAALVDPALATLGDAERAYLAACWLRRAEVDLCCTEDDDAPPDAFG